MAIVIVDEDLRLMLLEQLPSLKEGTTRALVTLTAPMSLEQRIKSIVRSGNVDFGMEEASIPFSHKDSEHLVILPARIASGSIPMHQDCFNPLDAAEHLPIEDYIGILYLDGIGSLVVDDGAGEQVVDVLPGRFVAWHNASCYHRFDAPPGGGVRAMVGPMAIDAEGCTQRAHDFWAQYDPSSPDYIPRPPPPVIIKKDVILTSFPGSGAGEYKLVGKVSDGSSWAEVVVSTGQTFGSVKNRLAQAVRHVMSEGNTPLRFFLEDGTLLDACHLEVNIVQLMGGDPKQLCKFSL